MNKVNEMSDSELDKIISDTVSLVIEKLVKEIKSETKAIAICRTKFQHWQIRELNAAIRCGENLVQLRKTFGDSGAGFKKLIETEFINDFSYKTCLRYMKLYNGKNELKGEINNIRQAYIKLGIVTETYNYPVENAEIAQVVNANCKANSSPPTTETPTVKTPPEEPTSKPMPSSSSILVAFKDPNKSEDSEKTLLEFILTKDGQVVQRRAGTTAPPREMPPTGHKWFCNHLKPYVEWYHQNVRETNVIHFTHPTPAEVENIAA